MLKSKIKPFCAALFALALAVCLLPGSKAASYTAVIDFLKEEVTVDEAIAWYSTSSGSGFKAVTGSVIPIDSNMFGKTLYFRVEEKGKNVKSLKIPKRPAKPKPKVDYSKERLTGISDRMEITVVGSSVPPPVFDPATRICSLTSVIPAYDDPDLELSIVLKPAEPTEARPLGTAFASDPVSVIIKARPPIPDIGTFKYDPSKNLLKTGSGYQISVDGPDGKYTSVSTSGYKFKSASLENVYIRTAPVTSGSKAAFASEPVLYGSFPNAADAPTGIMFTSSSDTVDWVNEAYEYKVDDGSWVSIAKGSTKLKIESRLLTTKSTTIYVRQKSSAGNLASEPVSLTFNPRDTSVSPSDGSPAPPASLPYLNAVDETVEGLDPSVTYEYRYGSSGEFTPIAGSVMTSIDANKKQLQIRVQGENGTFSVGGGTITPASAYKIITIPQRRTQTKVTLDMSPKTGAVFKNVSEGMEYKIGNGAWILITAGDPGFDAGAGTFEAAGFIGMTVYFRWPALNTGAMLASPPQSFAIADNANAPASIYLNRANEQLAGLSRAMEYRYDTGSGFTDWIQCSGTTINDVSQWLDEANGGNIVFQARRKATVTRVESNPFEMTIDGREPFPSGQINLDRKLEILKGVTEQYQYSVNGGATWRTAWRDMSISGLIPAYGKDSIVLLIRVKPTPDTVGSLSISYDLPQRAAPPKVTMSYRGEDGNGMLEWEDKIAPNPVQIECKNGDDGEWYSYTSDHDFLRDAQGNRMKLTSALKLYVRTKDSGTGDFSNSSIVTINIAARPNIPTPVINYENEQITGITKAMQWDINGQWEDIPDHAFDIRRSMYISVTDNADPTKNYDLYGKTVNFRYAPTDRTLASFERELAIAGKPGIPTLPEVDIAFDSAKEIITGGVPRNPKDKMNTPLEYRVEDTSDGTVIKDWTTFPLYDALDVSSYIDVGTTTSVIVFYYRYKATMTTPASEIAQLPNNTIKPRANAPSVSLTTLSESVNTSASMQYSLNNGGTWQDCDANMSVSNILSGMARTMLIRTKGTALAVASAATELTLPARANPPAVYLDDTKKVLKGTTTDMEYSADNGKTWKACTADMSYTSLQEPINKKVLVRVKATSSRVASLSTELTIPARLQ